MKSKIIFTFLIIILLFLSFLIVELTAGYGGSHCSCEPDWYNVICYCDSYCSNSGGCYQIALNEDPECWGLRCCWPYIYECMIFKTTIRIICRLLHEAIQEVHKQESDHLQGN